MFLLEGEEIIPEDHTSFTFVSNIFSLWTSAQNYNLPLKLRKALVGDEFQHTEIKRHFIV